MLRGLALSIFVALAIATPVTLPENDPSRFTYYTMPTAFAGPCDLVNGPDGLIWGDDVSI